MVRYVKNEGRPALGFAVESEESDESSDDEPLSDQPSLATLVSENPGSPPDSHGSEYAARARLCLGRSPGLLRGSANDAQRLKRA